MKFINERNILLIKYTMHNHVLYLVHEAIIMPYKAVNQRFIA